LTNIEFKSKQGFKSEKWSIYELYSCWQIIAQDLSNGATRVVAEFAKLNMSERETDLRLIIKAPNGYELAKRLNAFVEGLGPQDAIDAGLIHKLSILQADARVIIEGIEK
jgi:hypothetical protein